MEKRELVALLSLSFWCLMIVVWFFLAVSWVCLQFVNVVFPDHTHYFVERMNKNTPVQVNKTFLIIADCLTTVRIHGREREREREREKDVCNVYRVKYYCL